MIDLCGVFGVKEGEEFKITKSSFKYVIRDNKLKRIFNNSDEIESNMRINDLSKTEVIKLPKKKAFTDDELAIMRSLPKKFKWIARDKADDILCLYQRKPTKNESGNWDINGDWYIIAIYKHLFKSITSEDEEPVFIDDYVERQGEE